MSEQKTKKFSVGVDGTAPDLLESAKHLFVCDVPEEIDFRCPGCNAARDAIRKAEGR